MVFSRNLFDENLLLTNRSLNWKVSSSSFIFEYDSVPHLIFNDPIDLICIAIQIKSIGSLNIRCGTESYSKIKDEEETFQFKDRFVSNKFSSNKFLENTINLSCWEVEELVTID